MLLTAAEWSLVGGEMGRERGPPEEIEAARSHENVARLSLNSLAAMVLEGAL